MLHDKKWVTIRPARMRLASAPLVMTEAVDGEVVWCVRNRNKTLVTRRHGKVVILGNCVPTRYKAGGDFDATDGEVSIQELDIAPHAIEEFVLGELSFVV